MNVRQLTAVSIFAIVASITTGCIPQSESRELQSKLDEARAQRNDIQAQLLSLQEQISVMQAEAPQSSEPTRLELKPVTPAAAVVTPPPSKRAMLEDLASKPRVVAKPRKSSASSKKSGSSLRRKHIRVPVPVQVIQTGLKSAGMSVGKVDGVVGKQTIEAIKSFQRKEGLKPVDGVVGPATWGKLQKYVN